MFFTFILNASFAQVTNAENGLKALNAITVLPYYDDIKVHVDRNGNDLFESIEAPGPGTQFKEILGVGFSYKF